MPDKNILPTKRQRLDEAHKEFVIVSQDAIDQAKDAGKPITADKIVKLKKEISDRFKELRPLIQQEPGDSEIIESFFL